MRGNSQLRIPSRKKVSNPNETTETARNFPAIAGGPGTVRIAKHVRVLFTTAHGCLPRMIF